MAFFPVFLSVILVACATRRASLKKRSKMSRPVWPDWLVTTSSLLSTTPQTTSVAVLKALTGERGLANLQVYSLTKEVDTASGVGLENALGDIIAVIDPLADDINFLPEMLDKAVHGAEVVVATNSENCLQSLAYRAAYAAFYSLYKRLNGIHLAKEAPHTDCSANA